MKQSVRCHPADIVCYTHWITTASSSRIREVLSGDDQLRALLLRLDNLRGHEREEALAFLLGVDPQADQDARRRNIPAAILESANHDSLESFKKFSQAIQSAVESSDGVQKGLAWDAWP